MSFILHYINIFYKYNLLIIGCLPSLVASKFNSKYVVITDYPLPEILDNINNIISINSNNLNKDNIKIRGLEWGNINDIKAC